LKNSKNVKVNVTIAVENPSSAQNLFSFRLFSVVKQLHGRLSLLCQKNSAVFKKFMDGWLQAV
jgi:hypothetical protein